MKVFKGGYKIVSLLNIDITSDFTISGIYDDIKDSHGKPILVSEINVGGEKMNDAYTIVKQDSTDYIIEVYGYSLTIASDDSVTVAVLPEITSIGSGLDLTDGELSATISGGNIYWHKYTLKEKTGTAFRLNLEFCISKDTVFTDIEELINYFIPQDSTFLNMSGTGTYGTSGSQQLVGGFNYYTSSPTQISIQSWSGSAYSGNNYQFSNVEFQNAMIKKV